MLRCAVDLSSLFCHPTVDSSIASCYCSCMERTKFEGLVERQGRKTLWIASKLGVSRTAVHRWMTGERGIPVKRQQQIAKLLGVVEEEVA